jgi:hypothetical protein
MDFLVPADEIERLTGYRRPADQLRALLARGFYRACRNRLGDVVLERPHYDAVCAAQPAAAGADRDRPPVRLLKRAA